MKTCLCCGKILKYGKKYCSISCQQKFQFKNRCKEVEKQGHFTTKTNLIAFTKRYLIENFGLKCSICQRKEWEGNTIPLLVDHINGNPYDQRIENFRLICPNCDALLPTYKGRNKGNGRKERRKKTNADIV